jgi:hypothetical protein
MADFNGSLVGAIIGPGAARLGNHPAIPLALRGGSDQVFVRDTIELATAFAQNDRVFLGAIPSDAIINPLTSTVWFDDLGASITMDIGSTAAENALCAAQDVATAAGSCSVVRSLDVANYWRPLWQNLGLSADPGGTIDLWAKLEGGDPGTGTMTWQIAGQRRL